MAQQMMEEYKVEYAAEQEAKRLENTSIIYVQVAKDSEVYYLAMQGSLYEELTWSMIEEAFNQDARFNGYKISRIINKNAVEVFIGRNYTSTRYITITLK
jgi:hypothetical protein